MAYKTYKIDLSEEQEKFLQDRKLTEGITLGWQLTQAVKQYIKTQQNESRPNN